MKDQIRFALQLAANLPTCQGCAEENHSVVVAAMDALKELDAARGAESASFFCECGHSKFQHATFSDHDECIGYECECDQFRPRQVSEAVRSAAARVEPATTDITQLTSHEAANPNAHQRFLTKCYSPIDYPEDFGHENGNYISACHDCGRDFIGHKRRMICKLCVNASLGATPPAPGLPDKETGLANCPFCGSDQWEFYYFSGCGAIRCKNIDCYFHGLPTKPAEAVREIKTNEEIATELETLMIGLHWDTDYGSGMIMKKAVAALREAHQQK